MTVRLTGDNWFTSLIYEGQVQNKVNLVKDFYSEYRIHYLGMNSSHQTITESMEKIFISCTHACVKKKERKKEKGLNLDKRAMWETEKRRG